MLNTTKLYSLISLWMTLIFTQGHKVKGKLEHVLWFLHEATQMFVMIDYVRKMTAKKSCKYGEYGPFEHLLFLFSNISSNAKVIGRGKTLLRNKKKAIFHCKTGGYNPNQDALHQLPRHQQTIIFRLWTGHSRLNSHVKRTGVKTSAQCPCGEAEQTPEHYLQSCSLHQQARAADMVPLVCPSKPSSGVCRGFVPDIQIWWHSRERESSQLNHHIERRRRRRIGRGKMATFDFVQCTLHAAVLFRPCEILFFFFFFFVGKSASSLCRFHISTAADKIVWANLSHRCTLLPGQ